MKRLLLVWLVCISLALGGCLAFPKKAGLDKIHDTYRMEFAETFLSDGSTNTCKIADPSKTVFPKTLDAIREYEATYRGDGSTKIELAHLTVLKAMIHLQAGNFGIAENLKEAVKNADIAATDDREVRDSLLKQAYPYLIDGWKVACDTLDKAKGSLMPDDDPAGTLSKKLNEAAEGISNVVSPVIQQSKRPGVATDDGTIYLATTANIFQYYSYRIKVDICANDPDQKKCKDNLKRTNPDLDRTVRNGASLVFSLLTAEEQNAATCDAARDKGWTKVVTQGRIRYVEWYRRMNKELNLADCRDK